MKEIIRICLKTEAAIATLLAEHPSAVYPEEQRDLEKAMKTAQNIRSRSA